MAYEDAKGILIGILIMVGLIFIVVSAILTVSITRDAKERKGQRQLENEEEERIENQPEHTRPEKVDSEVKDSDIIYV